MPLLESTLSCQPALSFSWGKMSWEILLVLRREENNLVAVTTPGPPHHRCRPFIPIPNLEMVNEFGQESAFHPSFCSCYPLFHWIMGRGQLKTMALSGRHCSRCSWNCGQASSTEASQVFTNACKGRVTRVILGNLLLFPPKMLEGKKLVLFRRVIPESWTEPF